jgi:hypothetical protein
MKLIWVDAWFYVGFMGIYRVQSQIIQLMIGCTAPWGVSLRSGQSWKACEKLQHKLEDGCERWVHHLSNWNLSWLIRMKNAPNSFCNYRFHVQKLVFWKRNVIIWNLNQRQNCHQIHAQFLVLICFWVLEALATSVPSNTNTMALPNKQDVVHLPTVSTLWTPKKHLFQFKQSKHFHQRNRFTYCEN